MAVSGLPEPCTTHARDMARLALDMMDMSRDVFLDGENVVIIKITNFYKHLWLKYFFLLENYSWYTFWGSGNWSDWSSHATLLSVWQHCKSYKPY